MSAKSRRRSMGASSSETEANEKGAGERLQKVLARAGVASRRGGEELIEQGRVTVNGRVARLGDKVDAAADAIKVDGRRIKLAQVARYLVLNKPRECVTTRSDPQGRATVLDLVPAGLRRGLFPVGRLDYDSEGLLLLTTDGDFAQRLTHPRHGCAKIYEVKVKGHPSEAALEKLRAGVVLRGRRTAPCEIRPLRKRHDRAAVANSWWSVRLSEGRTRQIREMFLRVGHPVQRLRRVAIGPLRAPRLALGSFRELTAAEVSRLLGSTR